MVTEDPLAALDFTPTCDMVRFGIAKCTLAATTRWRMSCGCVVLSCGIHALNLRTAKAMDCAYHGASGVTFTGHGPLEGAPS